jgi:HPt (histidine-containing phosphotransfer) domain-containing protein
MADADGFAVRMREMSQRFLVRCRADADTLAACLPALTPANIAVVRTIAHGLAGAGGTFGFAAISRLALDLEAAADTGVPEAIIGRAEPLIAEIRQASGA